MQDFYIREIVTAIIALIGGGLITWLRFFRESKKEDKKDQREFDARERDKYKQKTEEQDQRITQLELLTIASNNPEWRKNSKGIYEYVSPSYEVQILLPMDKRREDVIGKKDEEVFVGWPSVWKPLKELDHEAALSPYKTAIKRGIRFPYNDNEMMVIKEIAQTIDDKTYFIGRAYPDEICKL